MHRLIDSYKLSETVHRVLCAAEILVTCRVVFRSEARVLPGLLVHGLQGTDCDYPDHGIYSSMLPDYMQEHP